MSIIEEVLSALDNELLKLKKTGIEISVDRKAEIVEMIYDDLEADEIPSDRRRELSNKLPEKIRNMVFKDCGT